MFASTSEFLWEELSTRFGILVIVTSFSMEEGFVSEMSLLSSEVQLHYLLIICPFIFYFSDNLYIKHSDCKGGYASFGRLDLHEEEGIFEETPFTEGASCCFFSY